MSFNAPPPLGEQILGLIEPAGLMAWAMSRKLHYIALLTISTMRYPFIWIGHTFTWPYFLCLLESSHYGLCVPYLYRQKDYCHHSLIITAKSTHIRLMRKEADSKQTISACAPRPPSKRARFWRLSSTLAGSGMSLSVDSGSNSPVGRHPQACNLNAVKHHTSSQSMA